ncbi:MAG: hypothetical protein FWG72_01815 [Oscillospiraceae bacterium]|nr:hypothetical protein [Oscillospiraceae bacterium]
MLPDNTPKRVRRRRGLRILLYSLGLLLALLTAFAVWHRETAYFILNPGKIQIKNAEEIRQALYAEGFNPVDGGETLTYSALNETVTVSVALADGKLQALEAGFHARRVPVKGVTDALAQAERLLSPYLSPPEAKALSVLIAAELLPLVSSDRIDYSRSAGAHTIVVSGDMKTGEITVMVGIP